MKILPSSEKFHSNTPQNDKSFELASRAWNRLYRTRKEHSEHRSNTFLLYLESLFWGGEVRQLYDWPSHHILPRKFQPDEFQTQ